MSRLCGSRFSVVSAEVDVEWECDVGVEAGDVEEKGEGEEDEYGFAADELLAPRPLAAVVVVLCLDLEPVVTTVGACVSPCIARSTLPMLLVMTSVSGWFIL